MVIDAFEGENPEAIKMFERDYAEAAASSEREPE